MVAIETVCIECGKGFKQTVDRETFDNCDYPLVCKKCEASNEPTQ